MRVVAILTNQGVPTRQAGSLNSAPWLSGVLQIWVRISVNKVLHLEGVRKISEQMAQESN